MWAPGGRATATWARASVSGRARPAATKTLVAALVGCLLVACEASPPAQRRVDAPPRRARPEPAKRAATRPARPLVDNTAMGRSRYLVRRAVRDLKELGLWRRLTKHLYRIHISARDGSVNVPEDGHLADAFLTAQIDRAASGALCDILFYPAAIERDLMRQADYFERGQLAEAPASLRHFWVSILGHELAHCLPHKDLFRQRGERTAGRWEQRVIEAAEARL